MSWLSWIISNIALALLLALAAWFVQRRLRRPAIARVLWVLVLVKLVTPPLVSVPLVQSPGNLACSMGICNCGPHAQLQPFVRDMLPWVLLAAWTAGAGVTGWIAWRRWTPFPTAVGTCQPRAAGMAVAGVAPWSRTFDSLARPRFWQCRAACRRWSFRVGAGHACCCPAALIGQLNASQRMALLLHELVHIKRGDHLVRLLELTVGVAFWWLPIVGSIGRQLRACEEACCDAAVVAHLPQARRDYAMLLLDVIDFAHPLPRQAVAQATAMSAGNLEQRLRTILDARQGPRRTWPAGALAVGLACVVLPCQLQYEMVGRPAPAAVSGETCEPATTETIVTTEFVRLSY